MKRRSSDTFISLAQFLDDSSLTTGTPVSVESYISNDADNEMFLIEEYDDLDDPDKRIKLRHPKLYTCIRSAGVPLRLPYGIYFPAEVKGIVQCRTNGRPTIHSIEYLSVKRIICIGA